MFRKKISISNNVLWKFKECNDSFLSSHFGVAKNLCAKMKIFQEIPLYAIRYVNDKAIDVNDKAEL